MRYSLEDFERYIKLNKIPKLPEITREIIEDLASKVGSPQYSKTPQFQQSFQKRKKKLYESDDYNWESIRTFQATEFIKREGLDINLHKIRKSLNMLTNKNYDKIIEEIFEEFNFVRENKTPNDLLTLSNVFYDIISSNILYTNLYTNVYIDLLPKTDNLKKILDDKVNDFNNKLDNIIFIEPDEDYDKFCENNKNNEKMRAELSLFANLFKNDIVNFDSFNKIINTLYVILHKYILLGNKKNEIDEISELIYIAVYNSFLKIKETDHKIYSEIYENVEKITKMKVKTTPGITNKCIFKHMDLLDELV